MAKGDIISRLRLESGEFDSKIKRAGQELLAYSEHCRKTGLEMGYANKDAKDFAKALGSMQTVSQTARGKINELSEAFTNAKVMYKNMTDAERNSQFGRNLSASLDQLKSRLNAAKKDLADVQQELNASGNRFGQFGSIIDGIGQKMGINANITELLTSKTALMSAGIAAAGAIVGKATQEWAKYNQELAKQDQIATVTTGLKGPAADTMTDQARAIVDTYGTDFREVINAANTLMTQFGQTGEQSMKLISDGMQGMIQGDGPKLLSMIQQFAPSFRDAGISASQLVAIIQNSEGGIFTDQNMNAIVMGIKNIRLMTNSTAEALGKLGINGQEMTRKLNDGSLTIFQAMQQVTTAINNAGSSSQAVGEVMQQVFGRQGAAAGAKLGEAIATLNTNLEETKRQTGEVGDAYNDLYEANVKLNGAIREAFSYDGWDQMVTGIKSKLITVLATVIDKLGQIRSLLGQTNPTTTSNTRTDVDRQIGKLDTYSKRETRYDVYVRQMEVYRKKIAEIDSQLAKTDADISKNGKWAQHEYGGRMVSNYQRRDDLEKNRDRVTAAMNDYQKRGYEHVDNPVRNTPAKVEQQVVPVVRNKTTTNGTSPQQRASESIKAAEQEYARSLEKAALTTDNEVQQKQKQLQATEALWTAYSKASDMVGGTNTEYKAKQEELGNRIAELSGEVKIAQEAQKRTQEAARALEQAQKKLADAQEKASTALASGDLKTYYAAQKQVQAAQTDLAKAQTVTIEVKGAEALGQLKAIEGVHNMKVNVEKPTIDPVEVPVTTANLDAFIGNLKGQIAESEIGTDLYNSLTAQLADATALSNMLQVAVKNGIDPEQIGLDPKDFWQKVFGDNPGDYIDDKTWWKVESDMNKKLKDKGKKEVQLNTANGNVEESKADKIAQEQLGAMNTMINSLGSIASGIQGLGIDVPKGISESIAILQTIMGIVSAIQAMQEVGTILGIFSHGGVVHAAGGWGGIVPGHSYSGDNIPALLNSGETVLNVGQSRNVAEALLNATRLAESINEMPVVLSRAQQGGATSQIEGGGMQNLRLSTELDGRILRVVLNSESQSRGRGKYVTSTSHFG